VRALLVHKDINRVGAAWYYEIVAYFFAGVNFMLPLNVRMPLVYHILNILLVVIQLNNHCWQQRLSTEGGVLCILECVMS